jgi:outer membrane biosynthesis protein TonB
MRAVDLGLGRKRAEARPGSLTIKTSSEDWDRIINLKHHFEEELGVNITITDVIKASVCYTAVGLLDKGTPTPQPPEPEPKEPPPPPPPPPDPEPEQEPGPAAKRRKKPKLRTRY